MQELQSNHYYALKLAFLKGMVVRGKGLIRILTCILLSLPLSLSTKKQQEKDDTIGKTIFMYSVNATSLSIALV